MEERNKWTFNGNSEVISRHSSIDRAGDSFLPNVFAFMSFGLLLTGGLAYLFGTQEEFTQLLFNQERTGFSIFGYLAMFGPLILGLTMSFAYQKMAAPMLLLVFAGYAALVGCSLGTIFLVYEPLVIVKALGATSVTFVVMAIAGYTTKTDLSKMGSILSMMLIGVVVASLINMFAKSGAMDYVISIFGVLIFTGLTAYDMQQIKQIAQQEPSADKTKLAIMGAFKLYLDFINLFIFLLRLFGGKREN
jgi:FtsH-binding integral membrane protein